MVVRGRRLFLRDGRDQRDQSNLHALRREASTCTPTLKSCFFSLSTPPPLLFPAGLLLLSPCKCVIFAGLHFIRARIAVSPQPDCESPSSPETSPSPHFLFYPHFFSSFFFSCVCKQRHFFSGSEAERNDQNTASDQ